LHFNVVKGQDLPIVTCQFPVKVKVDDLHYRYLRNILQAAVKDSLVRHFSVSSFYYAIVYILSVNIAYLRKKCNSFLGEWQFFCLGELVGLAGQRVLPLTYLCNSWRLEAAASYIKADVSADGSVGRLLLGTDLYGVVRICTD
jgi:hypothetical protein